ncbi:MAG: hypothetical protein AB7F89_06830 [Pirellulaceae bacterium]
MKLAHFFLTALAVLGCSSVMAQSTDVYFPTEFQPQVPMSVDDNVTLINCETGCEVEEAGCGGWIGGFDIPVFDVFANHSVGNAGGAFGWFQGFTSTPGGRYWFGYQNASGVGLRGRFFHYNADGDRPADRFNVNFFDVEAAADLTLNEWQVLLLGGMRVGEVNFANWQGGPHDFDGAGLTVAAELRRLVRGNLGLVAGLRQSFLIGHTQFAAIESRGTAVPITELRFGGEWYRPLGNGATLVATAAYEHQFYSGLSVRSTIIDPEDVDISLSGPVFSLALLR